MDEDKPTPLPYTTDKGTPAPCPYRDEISAVRWWRTLIPVLLSVCGAVAVSAVMYSCSNAQNTGRASERITTNTEKIVDVQKSVREFAKDMRDLERQRADRDRDIAERLGGIEKGILDVSSRVERLEPQQRRRR